jgi:hypothetical protein
MAVRYQALSAPPIQAKAPRILLALGRPELAVILFLRIAKPNVKLVASLAPGTPVSKAIEVIGIPLRARVSEECLASRIMTFLFPFQELRRHSLNLRRLILSILRLLELRGHSPNLIGPQFLLFHHCLPSKTLAVLQNFPGCS